MPPHLFKRKVNKINKEANMATKTETVAIKVTPEEKELIKKLAQE